MTNEKSRIIDLLYIPVPQFLSKAHAVHIRGGEDEQCKPSMPHLVLACLYLTSVLGFGYILFRTLK